MVDDRAADRQGSNLDDATDAGVQESLFDMGPDEEVGYRDRKSVV